MPSSRQRRKEPGPLTASASGTGAAEVPGPGDPPGVAPVIPGQLQGVICVAGAGQADGPCGVLPGGTGEAGGDGIGRVPVQAAAGAVVSHRGAGIGVGGGLLDIPERDPRVEGGGDERVPQRVRPDRLADTSTAGYPVDDPRCAVPVQPAAITGHEDRPFAALADGQIYRPGRARR
jgi:hypothetical protein